MNSGKIVADGWTDGEIEGSIRGPRGPKNIIDDTRIFGSDSN